MVNTVTNRVAKLLGKDENVRWMNLGLYQGAPAKKGFTTVVSWLLDPLCRIFEHILLVGNGCVRESDPCR